MEDAGGGDRRGVGAARAAAVVLAAVITAAVGAVLAASRPVLAGLLAVPAVVLTGGAAVEVRRTQRYEQLLRDHDELQVFVEELRRTSRRLASEAQRDALTGLANRRAFDGALRASLAPDQGDRDVAVVFVDLDDFKGVNDAHGHAVGDALLRAVAERLAAHVRGGDVAARIGGDEFALLLAEADDATAADVVHRLRRALAEPFAVEGARLEVRASIGLALGRIGTDAPEDLLGWADAAMYAAKRRRAVPRGRVGAVVSLPANADLVGGA